MNIRYSIFKSKNHLNSAALRLNLPRIILLTAVVFLSFCCFSYGQTSKKDNLLTPAEKEWLSKHHRWRIGVDPSWPPIEMFRRGKYLGMGRDYLELFKKRLNVATRVVPGLTWSQVLEKAKNQEIDVLPLPAKTPEREAYLNFTQVLVSLPTAIITRSHKDDIRGINDLSGKEVSVAKDYGVHEWLKEHYPGIVLVPCPTIERALQKVSFGEVDAYVGDLASATYLMNSLGLGNLKVAANTSYSFSLCVGVRKDWPELIPILNKTISSISPKEKAAIWNKWVVLRQRIGLKEILAITIPLVILTVFLTLFSNNWRLRKEVKERKFAQEELKQAQAGLEEKVKERTAELLQANGSLQKSEEKYRELVEYANSIILRMDTKGNITFVNDFAQKFFGYRQDEILGKSVLATIVPSADTSGRNLSMMIEDIVSHAEKYVNNENENMRRDGRRVWIAWTNRPIFDKDGGLKEILCIGNDITKLKEAEKETIIAKEAAESASRAKSAFLANMSHELRTPLNAVIGFSEAMIEGISGPINEKQKEYSGYILESGRHLLSLINDVLDLSKVEAGKMELELSEFNLKELLKKSFTFIAEKAMKHNITLINETKDDIGMINADERKIKQVIYNILSNAIKFTPDGGKIGVNASRINDNEIQVCIWDTGIGIEKKNNAKIFAEFEQIDSEYSRKYAGTGLGMPLSKKFIELHGGKMWFESEGKDRGTHFYFTVPLRQGSKQG